MHKTWKWITVSSLFHSTVSFNFESKKWFSSYLWCFLRQDWDFYLSCRMASLLLNIMELSWTLLFKVQKNAWNSREISLSRNQDLTLNNSHFVEQFHNTLTHVWVTELTPANAAAQLRTMILTFLLCVACVAWQKEIKHHKFWRSFEVLWHTKDNRNGKLALQESRNMYFSLKGKLDFWCASKMSCSRVTESSYISVVLLQHCFKHIFLPTKKSTALC